MSEMQYLKDVVTLRLDRDKCVGCGMCQTVCPHAVFYVSEGRATLRDRDACMECGACAQNCPTRAITVQSGVGCAAAVLNSMLGRESSSCCCVIEPSSQHQKGLSSSPSGKGSSCC